MKNQNASASRGNMVGIIACFFLFAMISFVTNLAAPVGTIWGNQYEWSGMLGNMMNFLAYLFMGIPAGNLLLKIGNKKTTLWAIGLGFAGMGLQLLSSYVGQATEVITVAGQPVFLNFFIYLLGAFVAGFCVCMLNTVVNPLLNTLGGGGKKGNMLLQFGSSTNSLAGTLTPLFVGMLVGQVTKQTAMSNVTPLLYIALGVFVAAFIVIYAINIPEPTLQKDGAKKKYSHSPWNFRHTVLGVIGIFFYVGIEVGIPGTLIFYLSDSMASGITVNATAVATAVAACYWLLMLMGRIAGGFLSMVCSSRAQLIGVAAIAITLVVIAINLSPEVRVNMPAYSVVDGFSMAEVPASALLLVLCGLCTSIMWGGIFNLAVEGIGKYTAQASGIFMMMVVGGGVMPLIQNFIAGNTNKMNSELNGEYVISYNPSTSVLSAVPAEGIEAVDANAAVSEEYVAYGTWDGKEWSELALTKVADDKLQSAPVKLSYDKDDLENSIDFGLIQKVDGKKVWLGAKEVLKDEITSVELSQNRTNYMGSYWLVVAMLAYLLFYALIGSKNVNKDIPVEDEPMTPEDPRNL